MRRALLVLAVVLALSLAGCSGASDDRTTLTPAEPPTVPTATADSEPRETTQEPVPKTLPTVTRVFTTATPTPAPTARPDATVQGVSMPPGTDQRGIVNDTALAEAHDDAAVAVGAYRWNETETWRDGNGTWLSSIVTRVEESVPTRQYLSLHRARFVSYGTNRTRATYSDDGSTYVRQAFDGGSPEYSQYDETDETVAIQATRTGHLVRTLEQYQWRPIGTTTVRGQSAIRFETSNATEDRTNVTGTLLITTDGLIEHLSVRSGDDTGKQVRYDWRFQPRESPTVEPPAWLEKAKNATSDTTLPTATTVPG